MTKDKTKSKREEYSVAVYEPPRDDLPFLAVIIHPSGKVAAFARPSLNAAEKFIEEFRRGYRSEDPFDIF